MKSLIIVCASLSAVVASFPIQEKMKFKSKPLPPMNIEEVVSKSPQNDQDEESNEPSSFLKALPEQIPANFGKTYKENKDPEKTM